MDAATPRMFVKATDEHMQAFNGFQFEFHKTFQHPQQWVFYGQSGFHCCEQLSHVNLLSPHLLNGHTRYFIVRAWGAHDHKEERLRGKDIVMLTFQCMEFVAELKYGTLLDVHQAMHDIRRLFHDRPSLCEANLRQFQKMQHRFPSILKKHVKVLRGRTIVLENLNPAPSEPTCFVLCNESVNFYMDRPWTWVLDPNTTNRSCRHVDVYHADHAPRLGISVEEAKTHVHNLTEGFFKRLLSKDFAPNVQK